MVTPSARFCRLIPRHYASSAQCRELVISRKTMTGRPVGSLLFGSEAWVFGHRWISERMQRVQPQLFRQRSACTRRRQSW